MTDKIKARTPLLAFVLLVFSIGASAQVVVIPLMDDAVIPENLIVVAKQGGDYDDPVEAMKSITDAGENNRYTVFIGPGIYTLTERLVMLEYVDIVGSGRNATLLTGELGGIDNHEASAVIQGADHANLRSLSIENTGGNSYSIGVFNSTSSPTMSDLTITVSGEFVIFGVSNNPTASPTMSDMTITASGGSLIYGVYNYSSSSPTMSGMTIMASGGDIFNHGVYNHTSSSPTMSDMTVTASGSGGADAFGVDNWSSSPTMSDLTITASGGRLTYGVRNRSDSSPTMSGLIITTSGGTSSNYGVSNFSSSSTMSDLTITVSGGTSSNYGVSNSFASSTMSDMTVTVSGGTNSYGVYISGDTSYAYIRNSLIEGATHSARASTGSGANETYIIGSTLTGGGGVEGNPVCYDTTVDGNGVGVDCAP